MLHRHATDVVSLICGTIFAGLTAVWLLNVTDVIDLKEAWLAGPAILIIAGLVGLVAALRPSRGTLRAEEWALAPATRAHDAAATEASAITLDVEDVSAAEPAAAEGDFGDDGAADPLTYAEDVAQDPGTPIDAADSEVENETSVLDVANPEDDEEPTRDIRE
jgi:hypothetical protein